MFAGIGCAILRLCRRAMCVKERTLGRHCVACMRGAWLQCSRGRGSQPGSATCYDCSARLCKPQARLTIQPVKSRWALGLRGGQLGARCAHWTISKSNDCKAIRRAARALQFTAQRSAQTTPRVCVAPGLPGLVQAAARQAGAPAPHQNIFEKGQSYCLSWHGERRVTVVPELR